MAKIQVQMRNNLGAELKETDELLNLLLGAVMMNCPTVKQCVEVGELVQWEVSCHGDGVQFKAQNSRQVQGHTVLES